MKIIIPLLKNEKGIALPIVLSCIILLSILILEFAFNQRINNELAQNDYENLRAEYLAKSGLNISILRIKIYKFLLDNAKTFSLPEAMVTNVLTFPLMYPVPNFDSPEAQNDSTGELGGSFSSSLNQISGINLNRLLNEEIGATQNPNDPKNKEIYKENIKYFKDSIAYQFEEKIKNDDNFKKKYANTKIDDVLNNIVDWIDSDNESLNGGYEDDFYNRQKNPYKAKNAKLDSMEELHLIQGVTDDIYEMIAGQYSIYAQDKYVISELIKKTELMKWLSNGDLTDDNLKEIQEDFNKEDTTWNKKVEDFENHIRNTYRTNFNDKENKKTPYLELSVGDNISRYKINAKGLFRKSLYNIETAVDATDPKHPVFLYYKLD